MQTTITIDEELLETAKKFTGIEETSGLVKKALTFLVQHEAALKLIAMGGTQPDLQPIPRRRWGEDGDWEGNPE